MAQEEICRSGVVDHILHTRFLRRDGLIAAALLSLASTYFGKEWALHTPEKSLNSGLSQSVGVFPGWLERGTRKFIDPDPANKGHALWFRETLFANPQLVGLSEQFFQHLDGCRREGRRLMPGEALGKAIQMADSITASPLEKVHLALYALVAGFNPWFNEEDVKKLGVDLQRKSVSQYYWDEQGLGTVVFPFLFGIPDTERDKALLDKGHSPRYGGQDRSVHFAHHLLLTFIYLYSRHFNLQEHQLIPRFLKTAISLKGGLVEDQARTFSDYIGKIYEISNILPYIGINGGLTIDFNNAQNWPVPLIKGGDDIEEGVFDSMVEADYKANRLGAETAIILFRNLLQCRPIKLVLDELNDMKFTKLETEPILHLAA